MIVKFSRNSLKAVLAVILIFTLGALAGSVGTGLLVKKRIMKFGTGPEPIAARVLERLTGRLSLSEAQEAEIRKILDQSGEELSGMREKYMPEFRRVIESSVGRIDAVLDRDQKEKFRKLREKFQKRSPFRGPGARLFGGGAGFGGQRFGKRFSELSRRLDLSDEQAEKIRPILEKRIRARRKMMRENRERLDPLTAERTRAHKREMEEAVGKILTEEQFKEFKVFLRELRSKRGEMLPGRKAVK